MYFVNFFFFLSSVYTKCLTFIPNVTITTLVLACEPLLGVTSYCLHHSSGGVGVRDLRRSQTGWTVSTQWLPAGSLLMETGVAELFKLVLFGNLYILHFVGGTTDNWNRSRQEGGRVWFNKPQHDRR